MRFRITALLKKKIGMNMLDELSYFRVFNLLKNLITTYLIIIIKITKLLLLNY